MMQLVTSWARKVYRERLSPILWRLSGAPKQLPPACDSNTARFLWVRQTELRTMPTWQRFIFGALDRAQHIKQRVCVAIPTLSIRIPGLIIIQPTKHLPAESITPSGEQHSFMLNSAAPILDFAITESNAKDMEQFALQQINRIYGLRKLTRHLQSSSVPFKLENTEGTVRLALPATTDAFVKEIMDQFELFQFSANEITQRSSDSFSECSSSTLSLVFPTLKLDELEAFEDITCPY